MWPAMTQAGTQPPPKFKISHFFSILPNSHQYTMAQFELFVATRANQAALLPVVLIVSSLNEARP